MSDLSFENFIADTLLRGLENADWISEQLAQLDAQLVRDFFSVSPQQRQAFHAIYQSLLKVLSRQVSITLNADVRLTPQHIRYHPRFGWVLEAHPPQAEPNEAKIYLGKISLLENTRLSMGKRSYISGPCIIRGGGEMQLGNYCSIGASLYVTTFNDNHPMQHPAMLNFARNRRMIEDGLDLDIHYPELQTANTTVTIGNDVWVGRKVRINSGVSIGDGCVIAEGALVRKNCEAYGIYAGTPARLIRYRFDKSIIEQLQALQWWHWPLSKIRANAVFFATDLTTCHGDIQSLVV